MVLWSHGGCVVKNFDGAGIDPGRKLPVIAVIKLFLGKGDVDAVLQLAIRDSGSVKSVKVGNTFNPVPFA